jgi:hypothetical protein
MEKKFKPAITASLILDAQKRTRSVPANVELRDLTVIAGWCYWYRGSTLMKEFAYLCLEFINKSDLIDIGNKLDLGKALNKMAKAEIVQLLKSVRVTDLRKILKDEILPKQDLAIPTFESLFKVSTANRRRLQEMEGILPIVRWDSSKYGSYPVLSLLGVIEILHVSKELFNDFKEFVEKHLTSQAKAIKAQKIAEKSASDDYDKYLIELKNKNQTFENSVLELIANDSEIKKLLSAEKFRTALSKIKYIHSQHKDYLKEKSKTQALLNELSLYEDYSCVLPQDVSSIRFLNNKLSTKIKTHQQKQELETLLKQYSSLIDVEEFQQEIKSMTPEAAKKYLQKQIRRKQGNNSQSNSNINTNALHEGAIALNNLMQNYDFEMFKIINGGFTFTEIILQEQLALSFCQFVLYQKNLAAKNQKRWKETDDLIYSYIEAFEDAIYSHSILLEIQNVTINDDLLELEKIAIQ